jgi:hypothetical protein
MRLLERSRLPLIFGLAIVAAAAACRRQAPVTPPAPVTPAPRPAPAINSGEAVIRAMHDRYVGKWYRTITFTQKTTVRLASGSEIVQTWYEAGMLPGRLRIDTDLKSKGGTLFTRDSVYTFVNGRLASADTGVNELLLLGFDVYAQPANRTITTLRRLGFDLDDVHEGTWQGKPVYVVGAPRGDTTSKQFWIDRERMLFLRLIMRTRQGRSDFRFNQYVESGGGWVAVEVAQIVNGRRVLLEEYSDVRTNVPLSESLFAAREWSTATHWSRTNPKD